MANASEPQTDRELLLKLNGEIENLARAIDSLGDKLVEIEEKRIGGLEERVLIVEKWKEQISGGWKLAIAIWAVLTIIGGYLLKNL